MSLLVNVVNGKDMVLVADNNNPVPEPLTLAALGMGIAGLGVYIRHRRMVAK